MPETQHRSIEQLTEEQKRLRNGSDTTGDRLEDFLIGSTPIEQRADIDGLRRKCLELNGTIGAHGGELIIENVYRNIPDEPLRLDYQDFAALTPEPQLNYSFDQPDTPGPTDKLLVPVAKTVTTKFESQERTYNHNPLWVFRSSIKSLFINQPVPNTMPEQSPHMITQVIVGTDFVREWFASQSDDRTKGLLGFYQNCFRIGFPIELPEEFRVRFDQARIQLGKLAITELTDAISAEHLSGKIDRLTEEARATEKTPEELIQMVADLAIRIYKSQHL